MAEQNVRVLLADDHAVVRDGLRVMIQRQPGWEICGEASDGREAVAMAGQLKPDVAVLDMTMPQLNGLDATRQIKKVSPETEILIFTGHETESLIHQVFEAGARSYIVKTDAATQLMAALQALAAHKPYFTSRVGEVIFAKFLRNERGVREETAPGGRLTDREREIVQLLAEGKSNKEVGAVLGISVKTAETHRAAVMRKLNLDTFSELVRYAVRNHIIEA